MKVTFVVYRYWPAIGGVETYVHQLARAVQSMGHEVCVVAGAHDLDLRTTEVHEGILIHRFPRLRSPLRCRWWFLRHLSLFANADVVHVSNTHMLELFWRMVGPLVPKNKVFLTRHGMSGRHPVPLDEIQRAERAQQMCAGVVHDGRFIERWLGVVPDVCPDQGLFPNADDLPLVPESPPVSAAYVGRLEADTGICAYIETIKLLVEEHRRQFELHIYGEGSLESELRQQVDIARLPVHFHGASHDARNRLSDHCFAFVDGRMAIQEAFARRRVVLAAYHNPWKEDYLCGETFSPYVQAFGNAEAVARRVLEFCEDSATRAAQVDRAFGFARKLSWRRTAEAFLALWQDRLDDAGRKIAFKLVHPSNLSTLQPIRYSCLRAFGCGLQAALGGTGF